MAGRRVEFSGHQTCGEKEYSRFHGQLFSSRPCDHDAMASMALFGEKSNPYTQSGSVNALTSTKSGAVKTRTVLSAEEDARYLPSRDQVRRRMASSCAMRELFNSADLAPSDQIRMVLSCPPAATYLHVVSSAMALMPSCGSKKVYRRSPVETSQTLTVRSAAPETMRLPSGVK